MQIIRSQNIVRFGYIFPAFVFVYFLIGATNGRIPLFPIKGSELIGLDSSAAWIACLSPLFWLAADVMRLDPIWIKNAKIREHTSVVFYVAAGIIFVFALLIKG